LILSALLIFMYNQMEDRRAGEASAEAMRELQAILLQRSETDSSVEPSVENSPMEPIGTAETTEPETVLEEVPVETERRKMTVEDIAGYGYIGILSLPSLGLDLPVMDECTESNLKKAPCRYHGSIEEENLVIAGHNYKQHFGYLQNMQKGDTVTFTDMDGNTHAYEVDALETLPETAVEEMNNSPWELSLYTCTFSGTERITVRCSLVE